VKQGIRIALLLALATTTAVARADAQQLDAVMSRFVVAWRQNDEKAIAALIAREGASIESPAGRLGPLGARQAAAVLRTIFEVNATRGVRTRQMQDVGGSPQKAYAEVVWTALAPETTQPLNIIIFVELVLEQDKNWRVTRIRLMQTPPL
jgi:hypothetical protein